jgi:hypothetical protein
MFVWISNFPTEFFSLPVNSNQIIAEGEGREGHLGKAWHLLLFFVLEEFRSPTQTYLILHIESMRKIIFSGKIKKFSFDLMIFILVEKLIRCFQ